jgi:hypothetical protein
MRTRTKTQTVLIAAILALVLAACGTRSKSSTATTPAPPGATTSVAPVTTTAAPATTTATTGSPTTTVGPVAQITANWQEFFQPGTPIEQRIALLQNGESLRAAIEQNQSNPLQQQVSAKVTNVTLDSPTQATVTYDVSLSGQVALPAAQGMAVLENGTWKVSQGSFCSLISLAATGPIPGCS